MLTRIKIAVLLLCLCILPDLSAQTLKRSEGFLGFHFDFHAKTNDFNLGEGLDQNQIENFLTIVKPNYVQIDTKGHEGVASYPTTIGTKAGSYSKDPLMIWREATRKHNVALVIHFSGILDKQAVIKNPSWARITSEGTIDSTRVSVFSPYGSKLFTPQIKEVIQKYSPDAVWIDGDVWALEPDYSTAAVKLFRQRYGYDPPKSPGQTGYKQFLEFNRKAFTDYVSSYVNSIRSFSPQFEIGNAYLYSPFMPEKLSIRTDFLSADVSQRDPIYSSAYLARYFASQKLPWDLMAWSIYYDESKSQWVQKEAPMFFTEAAEVISQGGGVESYWFMNRQGVPDFSKINLMKDLAEFCRSYQPYSFRHEIKPEIGLLFDTESWKKNVNTLYQGAGDDEYKGIMNMLLDAGYSVQTVTDRTILAAYPLIIVPEWSGLSQNMKNNLTNYSSNGGKLIIIGADAVSQFTGTPAENKKNGNVTLSIGNISFGLNTDYKTITGTNGIFSNRTNGAGSITYLSADIGKSYVSQSTGELKNLITALIEQTGYIPFIQADRQGLHITTGTKDGKTYIHLVNAKGKYSKGVYNKENLQNVSLKIRTRPSAIKLYPEGTPLNFEYSDSTATVIIPEVKYYTIIGIEL